MPEQKADECEAPEILLCRNCDEQVTEEKHHLRDDEQWSCFPPDWKERAKKAEAELTAAYDEIFWTVPEAMPLVEKIKVMHGMEAEALVRGGKFEDQLREAQVEIAKLKLRIAELEHKDLPTMRAIDRTHGLHMSWKDFLQYVEGGDFIDYDGFARLATATHESEHSISPSDVGGYEKPEWATHVIWYNR